jgi:hypothetical protein
MEEVGCVKQLTAMPVDRNWPFPTVLDSFKYDLLGRHIHKSSSSATSVYAYDGDNLVEETNAAGAVVARYEQTQNIDEPLAMLRGGTTSFYHADGLGSVTSLSNGAGSLAQTYKSVLLARIPNEPMASEWRW